MASRGGTEFVYHSSQLQTPANGAQRSLTDPDLTAGLPLSPPDRASSTIRQGLAVNVYRHPRSQFEFKNPQSERVFARQRRLDVERVRAPTPPLILEQVNHEHQAVAGEYDPKQYTGEGYALEGYHVDQAHLHDELNYDLGYHDKNAGYTEQYNDSVVYYPSNDATQYYSEMPSQDHGYNAEQYYDQSYSYEASPGHHVYDHGDQGVSHREPVIDSEQQGNRSPSNGRSVCATGEDYCEVEQATPRMRTVNLK